MIVEARPVRKARGAFFTPPEVSDFLARWVKQSTWPSPQTVSSRSRIGECSSPPTPDGIPPKPNPEFGDVSHEPGPFVLPRWGIP